ncbi:cyclic amp receptor-like protein g [Anaeramoeba ignava]|uniref:Cyclic amp receptor-like protein g n=1 Tax=Anaeramoeba ignava TaxID=1746090 RepID=A0A9Q0LSE6_ANAIG|nr:cyclic amp receptor-like protein g [Anaeramoeba ignava]
MSVSVFWDKITCPFKRKLNFLDQIFLIEKLAIHFGFLKRIYLLHFGLPFFNFEKYSETNVKIITKEEDFIYEVFTQVLNAKKIDEVAKKACASKSIFIFISTDEKILFPILSHLSSLSYRIILFTRSKFISKQLKELVSPSDIFEWKKLLRTNFYQRNDSRILIFNQNQLENENENENENDNDNDNENENENEN